MSTLLQTIESARNETIKAMSAAEIECAAIAIMSGSKLPTNAAQATKAFISGMNAACAQFNQLMVEYHLRRMEIKMAADAANDYFDALA